MSARSTLMYAWLKQLGYRDFRLDPASEDASFRAYWRLQCADKSWIVMDAPPESEPCGQFIAIADKLRAAGLNAPEICARNLEHGFLILTDFGRRDYLSQLGPHTEAALYGDALTALSLMQTCIDATGLPPYDARLLQQEMELFHEWFLGRLLGITLDSEQQAEWQLIARALVDNALVQPQVFVHRDYHSRNLMLTETLNPGILDFQDAVRGPITYDLVSLLRDCYISWPADRVDRLALHYYETARANGLVDVEAAQFIRWFNLMGIQRHLKAVGIFSRLKLRDDKTGYLKDIPRTLKYLREVSAGEDSMAGLSSMIDQLRLDSRLNSLAAR